MVLLGVFSIGVIKATCRRTFILVYGSRRYDLNSKDDSQARRQGEGFESSHLNLQAGSKESKLEAGEAF